MVNELETPAADLLKAPNGQLISAIADRLVTTAKNAQGRNGTVAKADRKAFMAQYTKCMPGDTARDKHAEADFVLARACLRWHEANPTPRAEVLARMAMVEAELAVHRAETNKVRAKMGLPPLVARTVPTA